MTLLYTMALQEFVYSRVISCGSPRSIFFLFLLKLPFASIRATMKQV